MTFSFRPLLRLFRDHRRLEREVARLREWRAALERFSPPGHFYSPLPSAEDIEDAFRRDDFGPPFPGIDLNEEQQFERIRRFATWYPEHPFVETPSPDRRFFLQNDAYGHEDAIMLYGMLRESAPRRIIEVGSGLSSAAMLDIDERLLNRTVEFTFIDPDFTRLRPLLRTDDFARVTMIEKKVQDVPLSVFTALRENDVLFIDSSHVSKIGSDVNHLFFHVLPALAPGVLVHIHDIAARLEYPPEWVREGRAWNEIYLLRAFLMFNRAFRIELFTSWMMRVNRPFVEQHMPLCGARGGGQIWLRKIA